MDAEDATGDIDISSLEEEVTKTEFKSLPGDDFESSLSEDDILEDEDEDLEEEDIEQSAALNFLESQLPIIYKLIKKIPSSKKDKVDTDDEDEDEEEDNIEEKSFIEKQLPFLAKFTKKKQSQSDEDDEDDDLDDEEIPKKKRKLNVVQVLIIIAVVFVGLEFLFPEEEPVAIPVLKKREKPVPIKPKAPKEPEAIAKVEEVPSEVVPVDPIQEPVVVDTEQPADDIIEEPTPTITDTDSEDNLDDLFDDTETASDNVEPEVIVAPEPVELPIVNEEPNYIDDQETDITTNPKPLEQPSDSEIFDDGIIDEVVDTSVSPNITDSILKSLEGKIADKKQAQVLKVAVKPTNPPEYDFLGRGLVYNCTGKHWACIDSVSFTKCGENYSWNTQSSNAVECYPSELYDSVEDCSVVQQFKIDNVVETKFCGR
jgi:hypothetical protein